MAMRVEWYISVSGGGGLLVDRNENEHSYFGVVVAVVIVIVTGQQQINFGPKLKVSWRNMLLPATTTSGLISVFDE